MLGKVTGRWEGKVVGSGLEGVWTNTRNGQQWTFRLRRAAGGRVRRSCGHARDRNGTNRVQDRPRSCERSPRPVDHGLPRPSRDDRDQLDPHGGREQRQVRGRNGQRLLVRRGGEFRRRRRLERAESSNPGSAKLLTRPPTRIDRWCSTSRPALGSTSSTCFEKMSHPNRCSACCSPTKRPARNPVHRRSPRGMTIESVAIFWSPKQLAEDGLHSGFHLTADGVVVRLDFPHVIAACANVVTVPYSAVGPVAVSAGAAGCGKCRQADALSHPSARHGSQ